MKNDGPAELVRHLAAVLEGGVVVAPSAAAELLPLFTAGV